MNYSIKSVSYIFSVSLASLCLFVVPNWANADTQNRQVPMSFTISNANCGSEVSVEIEGDAQLENFSFGSVSSGSNLVSVDSASKHLTVRFPNCSESQSSSPYKVVETLTVPVGVSHLMMQMSLPPNAKVTVQPVGSGQITNFDSGGGYQPVLLPPE